MRSTGDNSKLSAGTSAPIYEKKIKDGECGWLPGKTYILKDR
jgi:hypothetical protein